MRRRRFQSIIAWICTALFLTSGSIVGAPSLILCVGPGGHVALELTDLAPCTGCAPDAGDAGQPADVASTPSDCACVDILLIGSVSAEQPRSTRVCTFDVTPPAVVAPVLDDSLRLLVVARFVRTIERPPRAPAVPRTVVLLI